MGQPFTRLTHGLCEDRLHGPNMQMLCAPLPPAGLFWERGQMEVVNRLQRGTPDSQLYQENPFIGGGRQTIFLLLLSVKEWCYNGRVERKTRSAAACGYHFLYTCDWNYSPVIVNNFHICAVKGVNFWYASVYVLACVQEHFLIVPWALHCSAVLGQSHSGRAPLGPSLAS